MNEQDRRAGRPWIPPSERIWSGRVSDRSTGGEERNGYGGEGTNSEAHLRHPEEGGEPSSRPGGEYGVREYAPQAHTLVVDRARTRCIATRH